MEIETSAGGVTMRAPDPLTPLRLAEMFAPPTPSPAANPEFTDATAGAAEFQAAVFVTVAVDPLEYFAVAVNCWVNPFAMVADDGDTVMVETARPVTVSAEDCGEFVAPSVNARAAVLTPDPVGWKTTFTTHEAPAARVDPHPLDCIRKSPDVNTELMLSVVGRLFFRVIDLGVITVPMPTLPSETDVGATVTRTIT